MSEHTTTRHLARRRFHPSTSFCSGRASLLFSSDAYISLAGRGMVVLWISGSENSLERAEIVVEFALRNSAIF